MKTLDIIQTLCKIGKIISKIVYICCIVGIVGCAVGFVAVIIGGEIIKLGGMTLNSILQNEVQIGQGDVWAAIEIGLFLCLGEFFVARMSYRYFDNELKAGTPFTLDGAKELLHLGISVIWIPILSSVLAQIGQEIIAQFAEDVQKINFDGNNSVILGVMFIFISLLCKYGAQLQEAPETEEKSQ